MDMTTQKIKDLEIVRELAENKDKPVKEQEKGFKEKTGKSRATFFRRRRELGLVDKSRRRQKEEFKYNGTKEVIKCYFCYRNAKLTHHINEDKKDNREENLIPLCKSCHNKIHRIILISKNKY